MRVGRTKKKEDKIDVTIYKMYALRIETTMDSRLSREYLLECGIYSLLKPSIACAEKGRATEGGGGGRRVHTWYMAAVAAAAAYFAWRVAASVPSSASSRSSSLHTSAFFCDLSLIQKPTSQSFFATARRIYNFIP